MRLALRALVLSLGLLAAAPAPAQSVGTTIARTALERHQIRDRLGRQVTYYVSRPATRRVPLR